MTKTHEGKKNESMQKPHREPSDFFPVSLSERALSQWIYGLVAIIGEFGYISIFHISQHTRSHVRKLYYAFFSASLNIQYSTTVETLIC